MSTPHPHRAALLSLPESRGHGPTLQNLQGRVACGEVRQLTTWKQRLRTGRAVPGWLLCRRVSSCSVSAEDSNAWDVCANARRMQANHAARRRSSGLPVAILFVMDTSRIMTNHRQPWRHRACNPEHNRNCCDCASNIWHGHCYRVLPHSFCL